MPDPAGATTPSGATTPADDVALLERISAELAGVDAALRRLDDGTYGSCEVCGEPVDDGKLAGDPLATRCDAHPA